MPVSLYVTALGSAAAKGTVICWTSTRETVFFWLKVAVAWIHILRLLLESHLMARSMGLISS